MPGRAAVQRSLSARVLAGRGRTPQTFCLRYEAGAAPTSSHSQAVQSFDRYFNTLTLEYN